MTLMVLLTDVGAAGFCHRGARAWLDLHGIPVGRAFEDGLPIEVIRATGCPLAEKICQAAEARVAKELKHVQQ